jgi:prepilin-type N-terminal cleavage/methylation domain-containing protein/prepilin-type processing-associated H-X9-DG protein
MIKSHKQSRSQATRRGGFTLIELLVVVAIIALLIAILIPSLGRAKDNAKGVSCLANLRAIGQISVIYNNENSNCMVPSFYKTNGNTTSNESWGSIFISLGYLPRQFSNDINHVNNKAWVGGAYPTRTALFCPSGLTDSLSNSNPLTNTDAQGSRPAFYFSDTLGAPCFQWYGTNCQTFDPAHITPGRRLPGDSGPTDLFLPKITQIGAPSRVVYFFDGVFCNLGGAAAAGGGGFARISARHKQQTSTNVMFVDGHGESVDRNKMPQIGSENLMTSSLPDPNVPTLAQQMNTLCPTVDFRLDQHP